MRLHPRVLGIALTAALVVPMGALVLTGGPADAADAGFGVARGFAVLAGSTVTSSGPSVLTGDLGLSPGTAVTGFPPGLVVGALHVTDADAAQAKIDARTAFTTAAGLPATEIVPELGGRTLTAGTYASLTGLQLTGPLILDGEDSATPATFVLRAASTLTTAAGSSVQLINGASPCDVHWVIGSSATLGTRTTLVGTVNAYASVSTGDGTTVDGRLLADTGAVTLIDTRVTRPRCDAPPPRPRPRRR